MAKMNRFISSCLLYLCLFISLSCGSSSKSVHSSTDIRRLQQTEHNQNHQRRVGSNNNNRNHIHIITLTNTTNTTNATISPPTPPANPANNIPSPTPPTTHSPTKKYIPAPPDDAESEIEKEATKIGWLFLYIVIIFAFIWVVIYYREAIFYFSRNAYNNTRRHGCKGFVYSFLPCLAGSLSSGDSSPILDQIIFETEDPNAPLVGE